MEVYLYKKPKKRGLASRLKLYLSLAVVFIFFVGLVYLFVYSPVFKVERFDVSGNKEIKSEDIVSGLKKIVGGYSKLAPILTANSIFLWNDNPKILGDLSSEFPIIKSVSIESKIIGREVKINIEERQKFGIWCSNSGSPSGTSTEFVKKCFWFDDIGTLFSDAPAAEGGLVNKIDDFSGRDLKIGEPVLKGKLLGNLLKIFNVLQETRLKIRALKINNLAFQEIETESITPKIYFSLRIDPNFVLAAFNNLNKIGLGKIDYIDFRVADRVYYKFK